jgi:2-haloacid dehalogenase
VANPGAGRGLEIRYCLVDVMGTVVDVDGSVRRDLGALLRWSGVTGPDADAVVEGCGQRLDELMAEVTAGQRAWQGHRELRRRALRESLAAQDLPPLSPAAEAEASGVVHRLTPWPDSAEALRSLQEAVTVVGLSNADLAELVALSRHAGLSWHGLLSGELVQAFKPDPAVYRMALRLLGARADEVLMVAAHPSDLRAAAEQGLATAYVARPGAEAPTAGDDVDLAVEDLADLARLLHEPLAERSR